VTDVGALDDFEEGAVRLVRVDGLEIGIVRWHGDRIYAIHNRCPHMAGPICAGVIGPKPIASAPGAVDVDEDEPVVTCAWHHWEFELATGRSLWDPNYRVRTFPVRTEGGRVLVSVRRPERGR
jgi:nitrite reductase/ring-hydroxylating ferredoxin subunit